MKNICADIVVIGGGHAGLEAAWAASQFDSLNIVLISNIGVALGSTPCNPAIGGVGKGQLVREIDSMGGLMGIVADKSAIQCRRLNESKGYAVQSTRFQVDKDLYPKNAASLIESRKNIEVVRDSVERVVEKVEDGLVYAVFTSDYCVSSRSVIVTVGTFLDGKIHRGSSVESGGRDGCESSLSLGSIFSKVEKVGKKFKTGTPARVMINSVNLGVMEEQPSDRSVNNFHVLHGTNRFLPQVSCFKTSTSKKTIDTIFKNRDKSPMFNGQIKGVGPRYCPSIEDKVFRYPDRYEHHVFVEPEGLDSKTIYPNGVSTSLPKDVQLDFIRSITGFEDAEIETYGYAVEYEVVDTSYLDLTLEHSSLKGVYFAGQVNGTSGYEEAAGQGLVAGLNSALSVLGRDKLVFPRGTSYLGVLIDDVVSVKRDEPYRLFTARSENRLFLREDNSIDRMAEYRASLGLNSELDVFISSYMYEKKLLKKMLASKKMILSNGERVDINAHLKLGSVDPVVFLMRTLKEMGLSFSEIVVKSYAIEVKYEGYLRKSDLKERSINKLGSKIINWSEIAKNPGISNECRQRITENKPKTYFQLRSIEGIRPATLTFVANGII